MNAKYRVDIIESESGWGQRLEWQRDFGSKEEADKYMKDFNAKNTEEQVPSCYMYASKPYLVDLDTVGAPKD